MMLPFLISFSLLLCGASCSFECNVLGTDVTEPQGVLESPPPSASNQNCIWLIEVPAGKFFKLNFTKFSLRRQQLCVNSFVEFTYEEHNEVRYCGDQRPPLLTFPGPQEVMFYSRMGRNAGIVVPGFRAEFWTENTYEACPVGTTLCGNGRCYSEAQRCDTVDDCGDGTDEERCGHKRVEPASCGQPSVPPLSGNNYIAGGRDALKGSWPWQVSLQMRETFPSGHFCGATLIDNLWVLTAAHCFETRNASMVRARFGNYDTFVDEDGSFVRNVEKVVSHPKYDPDTIDNDIALLKMSSPVPFSSVVTPACLPDEKETLPEGTMMYSTGWGDGKYMEHMEVLRQAMMPLIDFNSCNKSYFGVLNDNTLCTHYYEGGHSTCMGDSGGPLVYEKGGFWKLYGIVSWGHEDCAHRFWPSVYTNVAAFLPWIKEVIASQ